MVGNFKAMQLIEVAILLVRALYRCSSDSEEEMLVLASKFKSIVSP